MKPRGVNAGGQLIDLRLKLACLKAARDHIDPAIANASGNGGLDVS